MQAEQPSASDAQAERTKPSKSAADYPIAFEKVTSQKSWAEADACLRDHEDSLDFASLISIVEACGDRFPESPGPLFRLAILRALRGESESAKAAYNEARRRGLPDDQADHYFQTVYWATRDWEALATQNPARIPHTGKLEASPWLRVAIARLMCFELNGGIKAAQIHAQLYPHSNEHIILITRMLIEAGAVNTARKFVNTLREITPDVPELDVAGHAIDVFAPHTRDQAPENLQVSRAQNLATNSTQEATTDWALKHLRAERSAPRHAPLKPQDMDVLKAALLAALEDDFPSAIDGLDRFLQTPRPETVTGRVSETRDLIRALSALPAPRRALLQDQTGDCLVSERDPSGRVALVFSSLADRAAGMPVRFLDGILARQGFQTIFLRDYSRCAFTCGIKSLGATADASVGALRDLLAQEEARQLITIGMSGGGYASLRYGLALGADTLFSFSGGTVARPADMQALGDQRVPVVARLTERRATEADFTRPVRDVLADMTGAPRLNLYFSEDSREDRAHAEDLSGFATVCLNPVTDHGRHDVFTTLLSQGFSFTAQLEPEPAS